jgi:hypothetical protein
MAQDQVPNTGLVWVRRAPAILAAAALLWWTLFQFPGVVKLKTNPPEQCQPSPPHLGWSLATLGSLGGFLIGGGVALARTPAERHSRRETTPTKDQETTEDEDKKRVERLSAVALTGLLGLATLLLLYETWSLATPGWWPITYYVRCANAESSQHWATAIAATAVATILGRWFWYPEWKEDKPA